MILNASAENGASSSHGRLSGSSESTFTPLTAPMSIGDGMKSTTASSIGCTPLFLNALPSSTGTNLQIDRALADAGAQRVGRSGSSPSR